ncbi:MAG: hypothetical protein DSZ29_07470 [Aquificaceae bacterium]|nr:MAG: hypothetical protein DSZ29_07470 [Aquificaceae bacterium]
MNKTKILNRVLSLTILLLSVLGSYYLVVNSTNFADDVGWYVHLFFGDKKVYFFNIIPMTAWALVQLFKFALLFSLIASILFAIKRYFLSNT